MSYEINTRRKAIDALTTGQVSQKQGYLFDEMHPAVILKKNGLGWDVATIDSQGNNARLFQRIFSHPSGVEFQQNQQVWLKIPKSGETPIIVVTAEGGGSCAGGSMEFGIMFN